MTLERNMQPPHSSCPETMSSGAAHTLAALGNPSGGGSADVSPPGGGKKDEPMYSRNSPNTLHVLTTSSDFEFSNRPLAVASKWLFANGIWAGVRGNSPVARHPAITHISRTVMNIDGYSKRHTDVWNWAEPPPLPPLSASASPAL
ncbi:hypothetical protein ACOMHN_025072 [Nucella lapillus]